MVPTLALLSSPLLGPSVWLPVDRVLTERGWHTTTCAAHKPARTGQEVLDAFLAGLPAERDLVLVPHSNAGAYVPSLTTQRRVVGCVFVDAVLPGRTGRVPLAPPAFLDLLAKEADADGLLPPWTQWWDEADVAALFPDAATRVLVEREQQQIPISYFKEVLPIPQGWDERPGAYLAFGETYAAERDDAARRGWPVSTLPAGHLHTLIDPDRVATELIALLDRLGFSPSAS